MSRRRPPTSPASVPLPIKQRVITLNSASGMNEQRARVLLPWNEDELGAILMYARGAGRHVSLRGGGHSFDGQALGDDIVVSMERLTGSIETHSSSRPRVTVGAGDTWGKIVSALQHESLVMPGTVTTSRATAGGTLAADCLSRFSPSFGKEGDRVQSFRLMTVDGSVQPYHRPSKADLSSLAARTFLGAIGGFGYLGAIVSVTYRVTAVTLSPIRLHTTIRKGQIADLADALIPSATDRRRAARLRHATWATLYLRGLGDQATLILDSEFTDDPRRKPFILFGGPLRATAHMTPDAFRHPLTRRWFDRVKTGTTYVDGLFDFTFFMDANTKAREIDGRREIQQTFFIPCSDNPQEQLESWLRVAEERLHKLHPMLTDVGYLPQDDLPFYLSPNAHSDGFAVSYAFMGRPDTLKRAEAAVLDLTDILANKPFDGRVSLVKNVHARPGTIENMYGNDVDEFFSLKHELDPDGILRNSFLDRCFPSHSRTAAWP